MPLQKKQSFKPNIAINRKEIAERIYEVIFQPEDAYLHYKHVLNTYQNVDKFKKEIADCLPNKFCQDYVDQIWEYIGYTKETIKPLSFKEYQDKWISNWYYETKSVKKALEMYIESEFLNRFTGKIPKYGTQNQNI